MFLNRFTPETNETMSLLITDSGLGGLSMLAHLVLDLESKMIGEAGSEMKMVYLNAVPRDYYV